MKTSRRCVSLLFRLTSSMDTWLTGSWSRRTQPVPVQNCEVSWKGWSESPSGCLSAGCGPKLTPPVLSRRTSDNPPKSYTSPLLMSRSHPPTPNVLLASLGICWTPSDWCRTGQTTINRGTKGSGWCQRNTSLSGVMQQIVSSLGSNQFKYPKLSLTGTSSSHIYSGLVFMRLTLEPRDRLKFVVEKQCFIPSHSF